MEDDSCCGVGWDGGSGRVGRRRGRGGGKVVDS